MKSLSRYIPIYSALNKLDQIIQERIKIVVTIYKLKNLQEKGILVASLANQFISRN